MSKTLNNTFKPLSEYAEYSEKLANNIKDIFKPQNNFVKLINSSIPTAVINCDSMVNNLPYYEVIYSV